MRRREGIIDDIFLPLGKKTVHEIRSGVREVIRRSAKAQEKTARTRAIEEARAKRFDESFEGIKGRLKRNMSNKKTDTGKRNAGLRTQETAKREQERFKSYSTPRSVESRNKYQRDLNKFSSQLEKRFPSKEAFQKAISEESRTMKITKSTSRKAPAKKAPAKKAPAKKAPAKKAQVKKAPAKKAAARKNTKGK